jgi:hypothetical protein
MYHNPPQPVTPRTEKDEEENARAMLNSHKVIARQLSKGEPILIIIVTIITSATPRC